MLEPSSKLPLGDKAPEDSRFIQVEVAGQELTLFFETRPTIEAMVRDIGTAQKRVWLETYIFHDDVSGRAVAEALRERARAGVDVRVLCDAVGSKATPTPFYRDLELAGVRVHVFHSVGEALWKFAPLRILNRRNHRKVLVVDERVAYFGGMNIVDTTSPATEERAEKVPTAEGWRDVHVRLKGDQQPEIAESFERSWRRAHGEKVARRPRAYRRGLLAAGDESIQLYDSGPGLRHSRAHRVFTRLFRLARRRITLLMAYFLPVGSVLKALLAAPRRGVQVQLVVPGESDVPIVQHATRYLYSRLLRRRRRGKRSRAGFRIWERQARMLHSKVLIVDDQWVVLGSCNLDARSLWTNLEFLAVIHSHPLAHALQQLASFEIAHSSRISSRTYRTRTCWQRWRGWLAWRLRWWL
jgi:cardiolipin synthase